MLFFCLCKNQNVVQKYTTTVPFAMMVLKMLFIIIWKIVGLLVIPKNITRGLKKPQLVQKATPFISGLDTYIIETPADIQFCEVPGFVELENEFGDEGERISVFDGYGIQSTVVLD